MNPVFKKIIHYCKQARNYCLRVCIKILYGKNIILNNVYLGKYFEFDISAKKFIIEFGKNIRFKKYSIISVRDAATLTIGDNVFFNCNISINCRQAISIGSDCMFGENVKLYDHNHIYKNKAMLISQQGYSTGPIIIGKNCWVGSNVTILKNVHIGENVVIGAHCLIYKDVPSNSVVTAKISADVSSIN